MSIIILFGVGLVALAAIFTYLFLVTEDYHRIICNILIKIESRYNSNAIAVQSNPKNQYFAGAMKEDYDIITIIKEELGEKK